MDEISFADKPDFQQLYFDTKQKKMFSDYPCSYYISGKPAPGVLEVVYHDFSDGGSPLGEALKKTMRHYFILSKSGKELEIRMQVVDYSQNNLFRGTRYEYVDDVIVRPQP